MHKGKALTQILYSINRIAALALLIKCSQNYLMGWKDQVHVPVAFEVVLFRINVVLQLIELGLMFAGSIKENAWRFMGQLINKVVLVFLFLSCESDRFLLLCLGLCYGLTDTFKYWHLIFPKNRYLSDLRFTASLITALIIPYIQLCLMNNYIKVNAEEISDSKVNCIRIVQLLTIVNGFISFRSHLLQKQQFQFQEQRKEE